MTEMAMSKYGIVRDVTIAGAENGPLAGTTFVAKDMFDVAGLVTGAGNPDWLRTHEPAPQTAPAVARMIAAGCTLRGKSCTDELAYAMDGVNVHYGTPLNSQFPDRIPGGSSCGSVSAVAGDVVDYALGTDTAGSVRVPASFCGVFGFRPTHGRVSLDGVVPLAPSLDTVGWFARTASGLKACGEVLLDAPTDASRQSSSSSSAISTILVARDGFDAVTDDIKPALLKALQTLGQQNYRLQDFQLGSLGWNDFRETFRLVQGFECWQAHGEWITAVKPDFGAAVGKRFEIASQVTKQQFEDASGNRRRIAAEFAKLLTPGTLLCMPTTRGLPPHLHASAEEFDQNRAFTMNLSVIAPLASLPALNMPVHRSETTSTGISFLSAPGDDEALLNWCVALSAQPWWSSPLKGEGQGAPAR